MEFYNPNITEIELIKTCGACPEQYDAIYKDETIGYLRLRHGHFTVEYKGQIVYNAYPKGDGIFEYEEREYYLNEALNVLAKKNNYL